MDLFDDDGGSGDAKLVIFCRRRVGVDELTQKLRYAGWPAKGTCAVVCTCLYACACVYVCVCVRACVLAYVFVCAWLWL